MPQKLLKSISIIILSVAFLSLFGYFVRKSGNDGSGGAVSKVIDKLISFPDKVVEVATSNEIRAVPPTFEMKRYFDEDIRNLDRDIYGLNSFYTQSDDTWEIRLTNFKNDSVAYAWKMPKEAFVQTDRLYPNSEPRNPILLPNRHLIVDHDETHNLFRLDASGNIVWHNTDLRFHHAMNLADDGNIWICTTEERPLKIPVEKDLVIYEDDFITKVDVETGKVLYHKSTSEIFIENGYRNFVYGFSHVVDNVIDNDPLHLNDIEPVMTDGPHWKKGDVFLSFRHRSMVVLYRPATNKIIRLIFGPFLRQHDVDILDDHTISIFNNDGTSVGERMRSDESFNRELTIDTINFSNIYHYNFRDSTFSDHLAHHFNKHGIFTDTQGFHQYLSDGLVYVEEHAKGIHYFMTEQEVVYRSQGTNWIRDWVERPHWIRIYEDINF